MANIHRQSMPILQTNPQRLDYEHTVRIRVQNVPVSADDGIITRPLVLRGLDIISSYHEKLRIDYKLTNCETGIVKALSLKEALPRCMQFGQFKAKVILRGHVLKTLKCAKCFEQRYMSRDCTNDWKCNLCMQPGHKRGGECTTYDMSPQ